MFRFSEIITTEMGTPVVKVFMSDQKPRGIKQNGTRPVMAYIFEIVGSKHDYSDKEEARLMEWLHKEISPALHPRDGKIVFQNETVKKVFAL